MADNSNTNGADAALMKAFDLGRESAHMAFTTPEGITHLPVPPDWKIETIVPQNLNLAHIRQHVLVYDEASFIDYLKQYAGPSTRAFGSPGFMSQAKTPIIKAVIDYHGKEAANRCDHTVSFAPRYSDFWSRWIKRACSQPLSQTEFAELIEENRADVVDPTAARLIDIVNNFRATKKGEFTSIQRLSNGDVTLVHDEKTEQQGSSGPVPEMMKLGIPVFFNGPLYEVPLWIRFRVGGGAVKFQLKADMADRIEADAFNDIAKRITEQTNVAVLLGSV
jgi:hypothetical protein